MSKEIRNKVTSTDESKPRRPRIDVDHPSNQIYPNALIEASNRIVIGVAHDQEPSPAIFKLHAIACDDLFEWLSIDDLHALGLTCKRMKCLTGNFAKENYPAVQVRINSFDGLRYNGNHVNGFSSYIQSIWIGEPVGLELFRYIGKNCTSLKTIKIWLTSHSILETCIGCIQNLLPNIEEIHIYHGQIGYLHIESLLENCSNLKLLHFTGCNLERQRPYEFRKCPNLQHIRLTDCGSGFDDMRSFFQEFPNIRSFETDELLLLKNAQLILSSNATLDRLTVHYDFSRADKLEITALLKQIHERGFYKRLHLIHRCRVESMDLVASLPALEYFRSSVMNSSIDWPIMNNLIGIFLGTCRMDNFDAIPAKMINLEHVCLESATSENILAFIRHLKKLKEIKVKHVLDGFVTSTIPNLAVWNEEREKLPDARKVTIFLTEEEVLAVKWATNITSYSLVQIKRHESSNWNKIQYI